MSDGPKVKTLRQMNDERMAAKAAKAAPISMDSQAVVTGSEIPGLDDPASPASESPASDKPPMPESTTPVALGQYRDIPNEVKDPNDSIMPDMPATMVSGKIIDISIVASEFDDRRGNLEYRVCVNVSGSKPIIRVKRIGLHHFRGYFGAVWEELGKEFKNAVEEATR